MPRASAGTSSDLPKSVTELKDDPFRSLAGELRRVGGFAKDTTPFSEFLWADFLRRQMSRKSVEADFEKAHGEGAGARQEQGCDLSARLVRTGVGRLERRARPAAYFGSRPIM